MDKSLIFKNYNAFKKAYKGNTAQLRRLNRALGLAMSPKNLAAKRAAYNPQPEYFQCGCDDCYYEGRRYICKHQLCEWLLKPFGQGVTNG